MHYVHHFIFGIYPYLAVATFLLVSILRFEKEQYLWRSESSQILESKLLRTGSICFHIGILGLLAGHFLGLLTPLTIWHFLGISQAVKQLIAIILGGVMGLFCLVGLVILIYRRHISAQVLTTTSRGDWLVLFWLLLTLLLGLSSLHVSSQHMDGAEMVQLMTWIQHIVTFQTDAASYLYNVSLIFKLHIFMGMTLFVIAPFTRLVHIWSGFGVLAYLLRPWQIVRGR